MVVAWVIVTAFYVIMWLSTKGHLPPSLGVFFAFIVAVSLVMHLAVRRYAPYSSQVLLPVATLLNGIGYVEIARWNPAHARYQAVWFLLSAVIVVGTLKIVRSVRDLDRYRYLTLLVAMILMLLPLVPHFGENINSARLWVAVGPLSFQPIEIAKILLVFFFISVGLFRHLFGTAFLNLASCVRCHVALFVVGTSERRFDFTVDSYQTETQRN